MRTRLLIVAAAFLAGNALAKLPDPSPEAAAAAGAKKAQADHTAKVGAYALCKSQDSTVKRYMASPAGKGKKAASMPPCADPGKFVAPAAPAAMATAPAAAAPAPAATAAPAAGPKK